MPKRKNRKSIKNQRKINKKINHHSDMIWDMPMIQVIILLLIILSLAIGASYYAPSENLAGAVRGNMRTTQITDENLAGNVYIGDAERQLVDDTSTPVTGVAAYDEVPQTDFIGAQQKSKAGSLSAIECDDGIDNDDDGLIDLEDSQCKNGYDVSESIF